MVEFISTTSISRAAALPQNGPESLAEIADRLGYCSASSFIRAFKRAYGMTPHAYRRTHFPLTGHTAE
ncbi:MAG: AraC family transcriptional regulator [Acutalibacteraceae bacterium]|nr:AraC family transcriptional regulator [Acutalibacteraceae bacterium]